MKLAGRILIFVAGGVLVAQSLGYKIYGTTSIAENRPLLPDARAVVRLEAPNIAITSDGSRLPIDGITFSSEILRFPEKALPRLFNEIEPIRIRPDASQPSGVACERRLIYSRAQLFEPHFLPGRLPKYRVDDFGKFIRDQRLDAPSLLGPQEIPAAPDVVPSRDQGERGGDP